VLQYDAQALQDGMYSMCFVSVLLFVAQGSYCCVFVAIHSGLQGLMHLQRQGAGRPGRTWARGPALTRVSQVVHLLASARCSHGAVSLVVLAAAALPTS